MQHDVLTESADPARPPLSGRSRLVLGSPVTGVRVRVSPRSWCLYRRERRGDAPPRGYIEAELEFLDRARGLIHHARSSARCLIARCRSILTADKRGMKSFLTTAFVGGLLGREQLVVKQLVDLLPHLFPRVSPSASLSSFESLRLSEIIPAVIPESPNVKGTTIVRAGRNFQMMEKRVEISNVYYNKY